MFLLESRRSGGQGFRAGGIGLWRIRVEQLAQVVVEEHALGVEGGPDTPEIVPARVERGKMLRVLCVHLAPVRPSLVAPEDLFDMAEVWFILHTPVHMYCEISRIAPVGRA